MKLWRQWEPWSLFLNIFGWCLARKNQRKHETFFLTQDQSRCMLIQYQVNLGLYPSFATNAVCLNLGMFLSSLCLSFFICKTAISSVQSLSHDRLLQPQGLQHTRFLCPSPTPWGGNSSAQNANQLSSFQSLSHVRLFATPWTAAHQASLSITNSQSPAKPMSIESVKPSNHLILCRPLLLWPLTFPSTRVFSNESTLCIRWPKYSSLSFNISPANELPGLISFRMDWLDLLAVQGTIKSLQHHSSKASIPSVLSFLYSPTLTSTHDYWKNHSLD